MSACPSLSEVQSCASFHPLLPAVAAWLKKMINSKYDRKVSVFSGPEEDIDQSPPVDKFLYRFCRYGNCSPEVFIQMVVYILRYMHVTDSVLTRQSVHRLMIAAFVVAVKHRDDQTYTNTYYAKVGGIGLEEMNMLERGFLLAMDWDLEVSYAAYAATIRCLECSMTDPADAVAVKAPIVPRARALSMSSKSAAESSIGYDDSSESEASPCVRRQGAHLRPEGSAALKA